MENDFETLIAGYIENKIGLADHFLSDCLSANLKINLLALYDKNQLKTAGIGNAERLQQNSAVRSDSIYWLAREHVNKHENEFFDKIEAFINYLNMQCYAGILDYEFHYSLYESGSFYKKHVDQFQNNSSRKFSMISYLNLDWQEADGGQLKIHHTDKDQLISPTNGKTVFFKSDELVHEVLVTHQRRMSVTGWLKSN